MGNWVCTIRQHSKSNISHSEYLRPESGNGIPARGARETRSTTALVSTLRNIVEDAWIGVEYGVDEANRALADVDAGFVDQCQDTSESGTTGACAIYERPAAIDGDNLHLSA